jgi:hypothetical protein
LRDHQDVAPSNRIAIPNDKGEAIFKQNTQLTPRAEWILGLAVLVRRTNRPKIGVIPVPLHGVATDGSTRQYWVADTLEKVLKEPHFSVTVPPEAFSRVILNLMDQEDIEHDEPMRPKALAKLNSALVREGFEAFYAPDKKCYLRHIETHTVAVAGPNPHRPLSAQELERKESLVQWLVKCSEDELIEEVLLPLFRFLGFQRITPAGHKDKALEYGKDVWMRFTLPTRHYLYFGLRVKKGKIDAVGRTDAQNANVAEILIRAYYKTL